MKKNGTKNLTFEQKKIIEKLINEGVKKENIAKQLGLHISTVYYELKHGKLNGKYNAEFSNSKSLASNKKKGKECKLLIDLSLANYISELILKNHLSIIEVIEKCKANNIACPSRTTLYKAIDDGLIPNVTREDLKSNLTTMFSNGLVQIPKYIRETLNLKDSDMLHINLDGKNIILSKQD